LGTSENNLRPSLNSILRRIYICSAQTFFTFSMTLIAWQWGPDQCLQLNWVTIHSGITFAEASEIQL
jgi:hypothetical protein